MKKQCDICNRTIEAHLRKCNKSLCFSCLSEEAGGTGRVPTFNIKQKPVHGSCAICDTETSGPDLNPSPWGYICPDCRSLCETQSGVSWDDFKITSQQEWLVKANARILGPFSSQEVNSKLLENRLVPLDEIAAPAGRWRLIRDEEQFRAVINEIRNRVTSRGEKTSESTASGSFTGSDGTYRDHGNTPFTPTEKLLPQVAARGEEATPPPTDLPHSRDLLKSYAFKQDVRVTSEIRRIQDSKIGMALVVFIIAGVFATIKISQPRGGLVNSKAQSFQEVMGAGLKSEKIGDYPKALAYFSEARNLKPNDSELLLHLAPLTFYYDRQALLAQRMFKQIIDTEQGVNYKRTGYLGLGLIALDAHELDPARDYFLKVLGLDPNNIPATANLAVVAYFKDNLSEAEASLSRVLDRGRTDGAIIITMADINIAQADGPEKKRKLTEAREMMENYLSNSRDYQQEVLIESARILTLLGEQGRAAKKIEELLDVDPEQTDLFVRDWQVYRGRASWDQLLETLKKIATRLPPTPHLTAALGLSMYRGREKLDGAQSMEQALSQSPKDPVLMALAGWVELKLGRRESGVANIKEAALISNKYKLPHVLQARLCMEEKDYECAKRQWEKVNDLDPRSVEALHGLAAVAWAKKDTETATRWLRQGQALAPNYIPFLALNQELQGTAFGGNE